MPPHAGADAGSLRAGAQEVSGAATHADRRSLGWSVWVAVVTIGTGVFLAWLSSRLPGEEAVKRVVTRTVMPFLTPLYEPRGQHAITVVTVDEKDLETFHVNWPMPLEFLGRRIDGIVNEKPKAILIDLVFLHPQRVEPLDRFITSLCAAAKAGVQIFISTRGANVPWSDVERRIFEATNRTPNQLPQSCATPVDASVSPDGLDQLQWSYPMRHESSAARTIFCRLYRKKSVDRSDCPDHVEHELAIVWPSVAHESNFQTMIVDSAAPSTSYEHVCRERLPVLEALPGVTLFKDLLNDESETAERKKQPCPYTLVVPLRAFNQVGFSERQLTAVIADRVVMLGGDLSVGGDTVVSPVHARLPGVHVHAMALDNLITFDGRYKEFGEFEPGKPLTESANLFVLISVMLITVNLTWQRYVLGHAAWPQRQPAEGLDRSAWRLARIGLRLLFLVLVLPLVFLGWKYAPGSHHGDAGEIRLRDRILMGYLNLTLVMAIFIIGYHLLHQGPLSIVEYVLFPFLAHFLHLGEVFARRARDWGLALVALDPWATWSGRVEAA